MKQSYSERKYIIIGFFVVIGLVYLVRLFYLQVLDDSFVLSAENNATRKNIIYPNRGLIYDRNEKLMVYDDAAYDLMVIPRQVKEMDTVEFCSLLNITDSIFNVIMKRAKKYSRYKPSIFIAQITKEEFGFFGR